MTNSKSIFMSVAAFVIACAASAVWANTFTPGPDDTYIDENGDIFYFFREVNSANYEMSGYGELEYGMVRTYTNVAGEVYSIYEDDTLFSGVEYIEKSDHLYVEQVDDGEGGLKDVVNVTIPKFDSDKAEECLTDWGIDFVPGTVEATGYTFTLEYFTWGGELSVTYTGNAASGKKTLNKNYAKAKVDILLESDIGLSFMAENAFFGQGPTANKSLTKSVPTVVWASKSTEDEPNELVGDSYCLMLTHEDVTLDEETEEEKVILPLETLLEDDFSFSIDVIQTIYATVSGTDFDSALKNVHSFMVSGISYTYTYQAAAYLSSAVDIRLYESGEGVIAEFQTTDENAEEPELDEEGGEGSASGAMIDIYAKLDGGDVEMDDGMYKKIGSVKAVGSGSNLYKINVTDLVPGESYTIRIHDEEGNWHTIRGAKVGRFAMDMSRMSPEGMELKWTSIPGREYGIMYAEDLVGPWKEIARVTADGSSETYFVWYKDLGPSTSRFFKAVMIDDSVSAE